MDKHPNFRRRNHALTYNSVLMDSYIKAPSLNILYIAAVDSTIVATVAVTRTQINRNHGLFYFSQEFLSSELNWIFCFIIPQWNFRPKFYGPLFVRLLARILTADTKRFRISLSSRHPHLQSTLYV